MRDDAVIAYFDGDPEELARRFRVAAARYLETKDGTAPDAAHVLRRTRGIAVVLIWQADPGHKPFERFMRSVIGELGLPVPRVEHFDVDAATWDAITAPS